jgi:2-polyprenyl-3-methyl-5-hydroxy-6-metoxy-1,4-benzoquinol methylase
MSLVLSHQPQLADERGCVGHDFGPADVELEHVACPLCGETDFDTIVQTHGFDTDLAGDFRVVQCTRCGLGYTNPRPTQSSIGQFYRPDYGPHEGHDWDDGWRGRWRRRLEHAVLRSDFNYPPQPSDAWTRAAALLGRAWFRSRRQRATWVPYRGAGRLLDFGCGGSSFGRQMKEYTWTVEGLDRSALVATKVERELGIRVHVGTLPHPDVPPSTFDAITMWSSLEHVHDPRQVVGAARDALRPDGILVVYVPNLAGWSFHAFREAWLGLDLPRHLTHFTPETLRDLLDREGFRVRQLHQIGRDGWLRKSARRARRLGVGSQWSRACAWKPIALARSRWTELTQRADSILALAERA